MLDWFLAFVNQWGAVQLSAHVTQTVTVTAIATLLQAAKNVLWYVPKPYIKAGPALPMAAKIAVISSAIVDQSPATVDGAANVVRGVESILTRTEANAHLVDWAVTRTTTGTAGASSGTGPAHSTVDDVDAINFLLGVHL